MSTKRYAVTYRATGNRAPAYSTYDTRMDALRALDTWAPVGHDLMVKEIN